MTDTVPFNPDAGDPPPGLPQFPALLSWLETYPDGTLVHGLNVHKHRTEQVLSFFGILLTAAVEAGEFPVDDDVIDVSLIQTTNYEIIGRIQMTENVAIVGDPLATWALCPNYTVGAYACAEALATLHANIVQEIANYHAA